jgi:predicted cupin superfamily sugar epimerase
VTPDGLVALPHARLRSRGGTPIDLEPIPREGGLCRQTWAGQERADGRPHGTAIVALLASDDYSALHRLPSDEIWHHYLGDPLDLLLLAPDGTATTAVLGPDIRGGQHPQFTVPAGTWMGAPHPRRVDLLRLHHGPGLRLRGLRAR